MTDFRLMSFLAVWREGGFSRAAERLHLTQPAVTQHIQYLEADLGQSLFCRNGRTIALTPAGATLLQYAELVEAEAARTRDRIAALPGRRPLVFGATRTIGEFVMPECLAAWSAEFPDARISLTVDNTETLLGGLRRGELDFLFVEGPFPRDGFSTDVLIRDTLTLVCPPGNALAGAHASMESILGETLIVRERGSGSRQLVETVLSLHNLTLDSFRRVLEIGNVGAIKRLVERGAGISFLYGQSVLDAIAAGSIGLVHADDSGLSHDFTFVCAASSPYEPEYRGFLEYCRVKLGAAARKG